MTCLERLHDIKRKFKIKNMQFEKNKNKKFSKSCFNKNLQQDHKYKCDDVFMKWNSEKRCSFISWKKWEKKCEKNLCFVYDKLDH